MTLVSAGVHPANPPRAFNMLAPLVADLEGGREPRHRVRARLRAYRTLFSVNRKG